MSTETRPRYLTVAETAKLLRGALKSEFPGVKFSVRSDSYAGGASVRVYWLDGPTKGEVKAVCDRYEGASFDGMVDLKSYHESLLATPDGGFERVHFGADYVFANRQHSPEFHAEVEAKVAADYGLTLPLDPRERVGGRWATDYVRTTAGETEGPKHAKVFTCEGAR